MFLIVLKSPDLIFLTIFFASALALATISPLLLSTLLENELNNLLVFSLLQLEHFGLKDLFFIKLFVDITFSILNPQSSHMYSYLGIYFTLFYYQ